jgi:glycosyltransferase involved in cell wall biosynthesis
MSKKKSKVLIVATSRYSRGGISSVIMSHEKGRQWKEFHCKWIVTHTDKKSSLRLIYFFIGIIHYLSILPFYDIVHIHVGQSPSALRKSFFMFLAKLLKKKTIVHLHTFSSQETINGRYSFLYRYLFTNANRILVLSGYWKNEVVNKFGLLQKINILYNACTTKISKTNYFVKKKEILFAGVLNYRKGYADLIKSFAKIAKDFPDWKIVFAGSGEIEEAKELAKVLGIDSQCLFLGWISGEVKDRVFSEASIFCLPSYAEGFPVAVLDAWAYSIPVIATPVGGLADIVIDDKNVLLFNPGDIDTLSIQMRRLMTDNNLYSDLKQKSIRLANETFGLESINNQLRRIYLSL